MAELRKVEEFDYDNIPVADEPTIKTKPVSKKIRKNADLPQSPKKRLRNVSRLEKAIGFLLLVSIIGIAIVTIQIRTSINQMTNMITETQTTIQQKEESALKLEQQKNELSKADRIKDIAKKEGLSVNEGNLRKVK